MFLWYRRLAARMGWSRRRFMGTDPQGNLYYEELGAHPGRPRRTVEAEDAKPADIMSPSAYRGDTIPGRIIHVEVVEDLRVRTAIRERGLRLEEEWQKRKRELMKDEQYRTVAEQLRSKESPRTVDFEEMLRRKTPMATKTSTSSSTPVQQQRPATAPKPIVNVDGDDADLPQGQAESFKPGAWQPSTTGRR